MNKDQILKNRVTTNKQAFELVCPNKHSSTIAEAARSEFHDIKIRCDDLLMSAYRENISEEALPNYSQSMSMSLETFAKVFELGDSQWFEYKIEAFRKRMERINMKELERIWQLYNLLNIAANCIFQDNTISREKVMLSLSLHHSRAPEWDLLGYEVFDLGEWIYNKTDYTSIFRPVNKNRIPAMKYLQTLFLLLLMSFPGLAQKGIRLFSPDEKISFDFRINNGIATYKIAYKNIPVIAPSDLGFSLLENGVFRNNLIVKKPLYSEGEEKYDLAVGKTSSVNDKFREVIIPLQEFTEPHKIINLIVRVFNHAVAFQFDFPGQANWGLLSMTDENTTFRFAEDPDVLALFLPGFTTSHEGKYKSLPLSKVKEDTLIDLPLLLTTPQKIFVCITEAALTDYAGMYLIRHNGVLTSKLSPLPGQDLVRVEARLPHKSPWRVILISDRIGDLYESNVVTDLNEPCTIPDRSWIRPGQTTWPWWNGNITPDTTFAPGNNFETNKYYIDFCARNGIAYHSVVEYGGHEWYVSDGEAFAPGPNTDVTRPVPGLNMREICEYAAKQNVGIRVWVHWAALYPKLEEAFTVYENWGIKGLMVDFMDRDDQKMIQIQEEILRKAAAHHLHIQFHGVSKPTGLSRTWPNELTREGAMNYEYDKWSKEMTPDHDLDVVFTRLLAGPVDYHLGGFRAVPDHQFKIQYTRPLVFGTRCHMLAMYVVLESYLTMVSDYPAAYKGQPGFEFLRSVPCTWDETKVPEAEVGKYIVMTRRKGNDWYVGSITGHEGRTISLPLTFLGQGEYTAEIYADSGDGTNPNLLLKTTRTVTSGDVLSLIMAPGGGTAIYLRKK